MINVTLEVIFQNFKQKLHQILYIFFMCIKKPTTDVYTLILITNLSSALSISGGDQQYHWRFAPFLRLEIDEKF